MAGKAKVVDKDKGYAKLLEQLASMKEKKVVEVGIFADVGAQLHQHKDDVAEAKRGQGKKK